LLSAAIWLHYLEVAGRACQNSVRIATVSVEMSDTPL
jgi:hypothetical protein